MSVVTLDPNLTIELHTKVLSKSCFHHIHSFRQIHSSLDDAMAASVASALLSLRLDKMYSCFIWYCSKTCSPSSASPAYTGQSHGKPVLSPSILFQCTPQTASHASAWVVHTRHITFKALHTGRPLYLTNLLQHHQPTRSLHSSSSHQRFIPRHNLSFGSCAFHFQPQRSGIPCLSAFTNPSHFLLLNATWRLTFSSQLTVP